MTVITLHRLCDGPLHQDRFVMAMARAVHRGEESVKPGSATDDPALKAARDIRW